MLDVGRPKHRPCRSYDEFSEAMNASLGRFDSRYVGEGPFEAELSVRNIGEIRLVDFCGGPLKAKRGASHIAADCGAFVGVVLQRTGKTYCERQSDRVVIEPGDIAIWHGARPIAFELPGTARKSCMVVPLHALEGLLPDAADCDDLHLKADTNPARLLRAYLSALTDEVDATDREEAVAADLTIGLLAAALSATKVRDGSRRQSLFQRVVRYIDKRLDDPELAPVSVADAHNISVRYLYLIFGEHGSTVSAWIRNRRLARCRADLLDHRRDRSLTEIAHHWGFSDSSHFSRLFKARYGVSPGAFRERTTTRADAAADLNEVPLPQ